jgi:hypothetical protein
MKNKAPGENLRGLLVKHPLTGDRIRKAGCLHGVCSSYGLLLLLQLSLTRKWHLIARGLQSMQIDSDPMVSMLTAEGRREQRRGVRRGR